MWFWPATDSFFNRFSSDWTQIEAGEIPHDFHMINQGVRYAKTWANTRNVSRRGVFSTRFARLLKFLLTQTPDLSCGSRAQFHQLRFESSLKQIGWKMNPWRVGITSLGRILSRIVPRDYITPYAPFSGWHHWLPWKCPGKCFRLFRFHFSAKIYHKHKFKSSLSRYNLLSMITPTRIQFHTSSGARTWPCPQPPCPPHAWAPLAQDGWVHLLLHVLLGLVPDRHPSAIPAQES